MNNITYCQANDNLFLLGNRFLRQHKQPPAGRQNKLYVAHIDHQILAAFWIHSHATNNWLRSLFVKPEYRHRGIASQLIKTSLSHEPQNDTYGFINETLIPFYDQLGFKGIKPELLPTELLIKFKTYQTARRRWKVVRLTSII